MARTSWHLASQADSPAQARAAARRFLSGPDAPFGDQSAAVLLVSELVTNAVKHALADPSGLDLTMELLADRLRITVDDHDPLPPVLQDVDPAGDSGRGLLIVDRLATKWGWERSADNGKCVWCELERERRGPP